MSEEMNEKTLLESMESGEEKINSVIKTTSATFRWIEKVQAFIQRHGFKRLFVDLIVVAAIIFSSLLFFQPSIIANKLDKYREAKHVEKMEERMNNTPYIQAELDKFRLQYNASWVSVWEMHNSTNNLDGLPFLFASLTYESMNPALTPIADQFDNVRLSLYPLTSYLRSNEMWYGNVEELQEIDNSAYYRAKALGISFLGFKMMETENTPNAVMSFAFVGTETPPTNDFVQSWILASYKINSLLTLSK